MMAVALPGTSTDGHRRPGSKMTLIGAILIALGPLADICLGLVGLSGPAEWAWELAGDLTGALIFLVGLNLLVIGLITRL